MKYTIDSLLKKNIKSNCYRFSSLKENFEKTGKEKRVKA